MNTTKLATFLCSLALSAPLLAQQATTPPPARSNATPASGAGQAVQPDQRPDQRPGQSGQAAAPRATPPTSPRATANSPAANPPAANPAAANPAAVNLAPSAEVVSLMNGLRADDLDVRRQAARALVAHGARAQAALPELVKNLVAEDVELRRAVVKTIALMGPAAARAAQDLTARLSDPDPVVRSYAAFGLGRLGPAPPEAIDALAQAVADENAMVRRTAVQALRRLAPGSERVAALMIDALKDADQGVVFAALRNLADQGVPVVPLLIKALEQDHSRYWAAIILGEIGPDAKAATPALARVLLEEDPEERMQALVALGQIGEGAQDVVPLAAERLQADPSLAVRYAAAYTLGRIGRDAPQARQALESTLSESDDPLLQIIVATALAELSSGAAEDVRRAVEYITAGLKVEEQAVRRGSARALVILRPPYALARSPLIRSLQDQDRAVAATAMQGLVRYGAEAVPDMIRALRYEALRPFAVQVLAQLGPEAKAAGDALVQAIRDNLEDEAFRREAYFALGAIGPAETAEAAPLLLADLQSDHDAVRDSAIYVLGQMGPLAKQAAPAIEKLLVSEDPLTRLRSAWALVQIQPGDEQVAAASLPLLTASLEHQRSAIRVHAAKILGSLGPAGAGAQEGLQKALADRDPAVRQAAHEALQAVTGQAPAKEIESPGATPPAKTPAEDFDA